MSRCSNMYTNFLSVPNLWPPLIISFLTNNYCTPLGVIKMTFLYVSTENVNLSML